MRMIQRKKVKAKKGVSLLVALLVMSVVVAIGITVSTVVIFQVKVNSVVSQGHQNYYIAESGIEYGLNILKEKKSGTLAEALTAVKTAIPFPTGAPFQADLNQSIGLSGGATVPTELKENTSAYIELYNVDTSLGPIGAPQLCVHGESVDGNGNEVIEVTWVAWSSNLEISPPQKALVSYSAFNGDTCDLGGGVSGEEIILLQFFPIIGINIDATNLAGVRIRITALKPSGSTTLGDGDIKDFKVYTEPSNLSTQIQVKSVSNNAGQTQALIATFPWSAPLSSFYDFVIFSEKSLSKTLPVSIDQSIKKFGPYDIIAVGNGSYASVLIPANPEPSPNPVFVGCDTSPCNYYIRLLRPDSQTWGSFSVNTSGTNADGTPATPQSINVTSPISSCIVRNPYTFNSDSSNTIAFMDSDGTLAPGTNATGPTQYELLSQVTFKDTNETYCPGS